ncbi:MAG: RluA family pseudouridine synthase [Synoicihabitans sp.]
MLIRQLGPVGDYTLIHEDEALLVVDKSAGAAVNLRSRGKGEPRCITTQLQSTFGSDVLPAHRIDDEVGGLVAYARGKTALDFLSGQIQSKTAERIYRGFAVVATEEEAERITPLPLLRDPGGGLPDSFEVNYALAPDQHVAGRMHIYRKKGGRPAFTRFRVVEAFGRFVWFEARPETSRQMQVQAHLSAIGAPVLNDRAHGLEEVKLLLSGLKRGYKGRSEEKPLIEGLALQASGLKIRHPLSREEISFETALPKSFEIALRNLRKFSRR